MSKQIILSLGSFLLLSLFAGNFGGTVTLENRTDGPVQADLNILWAPDKTIIAPAHGKQQESWFGLRCIEGVSIAGLDNIVAGMKLNPQRGPCGSFDIVIGQDVIDKNQTQAQLGQLQSRMAQLEALSFPSGQPMSLAQLETQKASLEEYQKIKKNRASLQATLAEFDQKISDLKALQQQLQQKKDSASAQQAQLLGIRINATLQTGKLVRGMIHYGLWHRYGSITKWPGIDGSTEVYRMEGAPNQ